MSTPTSDPETGSGLPDFERLRRTGWTVGNVSGRYCVAWREADEVVFLWDSGEWRQIGNRSSRAAA